MYLQVVHYYDQKHKDTCCYHTCIGSRRKLLKTLRGEAWKRKQGEAGRQLNFSSLICCADQSHGRVPGVPSQSRAGRRRGHALAI